MWFNQTIIYKYEAPEDLDLEQALQEEALRPCPPHARFIFGWMQANSHQFVHYVDNCAHICFGKEERILPKGVIKLQLEERIKQIETQRGQPLKRTEKAQMTEDLEFELLPKAFCLQKSLYAFMDSTSKQIIINTSSQTNAAQLIALLRKSVPNIKIEPIIYPEKSANIFAEWISNPASIPNHFQLASDCVLFSPDDEKKRLQCKGYELPSEEILALLTQGLMPSEISMIWNERIQFTLTSEFLLKKIKCLDYLLDDFNETRNLDDEEQQRDASLSILTGELRALINDVLSCQPKIESKINNPSVIA